MTSRTITRLWLAAVTCNRSRASLATATAVEKEEIPEDLLLSSEYVMSEGNRDVILCERGIRTFSQHSRYPLDLSVVPARNQQDGTRVDIGAFK